MKNVLKSMAFMLIILVAVFSFIGCSGKISDDEAKEHIRGFLDAIEAEEYDTASDFLHPERPADLKSFFEGLENAKGLDFSAIEITDYTGFSYTYYDSSVKGSTYSLNINAKASDKEIKMEIEIVENDNGYGIYNFDINI